MLLWCITHSFIFIYFFHFCSGFSGFELRYSDVSENISINLSAQSGTISLSPMLMQFWLLRSKLSIFKGDGEVKSLVLQGTVEVVNFALKSIQYFGYYLRRALLFIITGDASLYM